MIQEFLNFFKRRSLNKTPLAYVRVFGCQQNESDAEKYRGFLLNIGFKFTDDLFSADFVMFVTCAIRHTAQNKIMANIGSLKKAKKLNPNIFICICGCMSELEDVKNEILRKNSHVDFVFGAKSIEKFPYLLYFKLFGRNSENNNYAMPTLQKSCFKSWIPIISGCDNFCSYCIVPYVRGRERSRKFEDIINECKKNISNGSKIITFLGQNVNSYKYGDFRFIDLINEVDKMDGDFIFRFMTSHPKDFNKELIDCLSDSKHFSKHLHLPVQSGNNRILKLMNRKYTREDYINKISYAKRKIKDLIVTSDIIVGFPGEMELEFEDTVSLIKEVKFHSIFTYIYSSREGTSASYMDDNTDHSEKVKRIQKLIDIQGIISDNLLSKFIGNKIYVFIEEILDEKIFCKTYSNLAVEIPPNSNHFVGERIYVIILFCKRNVLVGKEMEKNFYEK